MRPFYDVFVADSMADRKVADQVARALERAGLSAFRPGSLGAGRDASDAIWEALAECSAVVILFDPAMTLTADAGVELGAAMAWDKPIYVIHDSEVSAAIPEYLRRFRIYPLARAGDVARAVLEQAKPMAPKDQQSLVQAYAELRIPTDRLVRCPESLERLAAKFAAVSGNRLPEGRLVRELLRLRKSGSLRRVRRQHRPLRGAGAKSRAG